jgi:hypothetical protein
MQICVQKKFAKITLFLDVMYNLVDCHWRLGERAASILFYPEDGDKIFLQNFHKNLPDYTDTIILIVIAVRISNL